MYGKNHTIESKIKMSENNERRYGINNLSSRLVLDTQTGIFYESCKEASMYKNIGYSYLNGMLNGNFQNKTSLIYC